MILLRMRAMKFGYRTICVSIVMCVFTALVYTRMRAVDMTYATRHMEMGSLNLPTKKYEKPYHGHDFLKDPQFEFDERFKNPCWFVGDRLRCLPYCLLYGIRKCGTSSLFNILHKHPDVVRWGRKESQFFGYLQMYGNQSQSDQISAYVDVFDEGALKIQHSSNHHPSDKNEKILVDGSADSMYINHHWQMFPGNENLQEPKILSSDYIHHFLPKAKVLVTVRDPIERLYSEYYFVHGKLFNQNDTNPYSFHKHAEHLVGLYRECFSRNTVRSCVYNNTIRGRIAPMIWVNLGIYYIYMEDTFRVFGRENVLVLHMEDLNNVDKLRTIFKFLDLRDLPKSQLETIPDMKPVNARESDAGEMLPATRRLLDEFYRPFNERMADLMNDRYYLFTANL